MDLGIFQEMKFTAGIYTREYSGYRVVALEQQLSVEALLLHGANALRFQLASGGQWWYVVGYYLAPE